MDETDKRIRELTEAMRAEKDIKIRDRMMAVRGALGRCSTADIARFVDADERTIRLWMARFDESGIDGLRDAPGRGRPPRVAYRWIKRAADRLSGRNMLTPQKLRDRIRKKANYGYSMRSVRKILRRLGFSPKRSVTEYSSAADADAVRRWQADAAGTIRRAKRRGFAVVVQDESIFVRTGIDGRKLWSPVGDPVTVSRHGRRDRVVVFGALAGDGTRLMRRYDRFDGPTFVQYLKEVHRKWGKALVITDNAGQHKTRAVRKYLEEHPEVELLYLPTATPKLSAVEAIWKESKYRLVTSAHYETLEDLTHAVSEYFRTCPIRLDIYKFLYRCI